MRSATPGRPSNGRSSRSHPRQSATRAQARAARLARSRPFSEMCRPVLYRSTGACSQAPPADAPHTEHVGPRRASRHHRSRTDRARRTRASASHPGTRSPAIRGSTAISRPPRRMLIVIASALPRACRPSPTAPFRAPTARRPGTDSSIDRRLRRPGDAHRACTGPEQAAADIFAALVRVMGDLVVQQLRRRGRRADTRERAPGDPMMQLA